MNGILLDTHIWFWYLMGSKRLSRKLKRTIGRSAARCWLSPISIWELGELVSRGRVRISEPFGTWLEEAQARMPLHEALFNGEVAQRTVEISLPHRDPADHVLVATALCYELRLATADQRLLDTEWVPTLPA